MSLLDAGFSSGVLDAARRSYAEGLKRPAPRLPNMERRQGARYVADMSRRVPVAEMESLAAATQLREEALAVARNGEAPEARVLLGEAAALVAARVSSREAQISAASFHSAAAGFVEHVEGNHEAALDEMLDALRHCRTLRLEFGHSVEVRRIHLGRNVARLVWSLGRHADAIRLCGAFLGYMWDGSDWPIKERTGVDREMIESLRRDEQVFLTDQLLSETVSTCADARARDQLLRPIDLHIGRGQGDEFPERALAAQQFCTFVPESDLEALLDAAATYFEGGPGDMPMTWRRIARLVEEESGGALKGF